jgi:polyisoprenoid-binding protein YceI
MRPYPQPVTPRATLNESVNTMLKLLLVLALPALIAAQSFQIQPAPGTRFGLEVYKTGLLNGKKHIFTFEKYQGTLRFDAADPAASKVAFTLEAASIQCLDDWNPAKGSLDKIMETALNEMMDAKKHPQLKFESSSVQPTGTQQYEVRGNLTIRGIAKPVLVRIKTKPMGRTLLAEGTAEVKLTDYGLKPPKAALGAIGTKNEMTVTFNLKAKQL